MIIIDQILKKGAVLKARKVKRSEWLKLRESNYERKKIDYEQLYKVVNI